MRNPSRVPPALQELIEDQVIDRVLFQLKSGKEATVYVTEKGAGDESILYAAKVYRDLRHRSFRRDEVYREGRVILDTRLRRAVRAKTKMGRDAAFGLWVNEEATMLRRVYDAGADVPEVIADRGPAIVMEYLGTVEGPAPMLCEVELPPGEAQRTFDAVMANVELFLKADVVHGDLSAFNILYWEERPVIIDLPQSVDARLNRHACELLARDIGNVCRYFRRLGIEADPDEIAGHLWERYERAQF